MKENCTLDDIILVHRKINDSFSSVQHCNDARLVFVLNDYMLQALTAVVKRQSFKVYDIPTNLGTIDGTLEEMVAKYQDLTPYIEAMKDSFVLPNLSQETIIQLPAVDTTKDPTRKGSVFEIDSTVSFLCVRATSMFTSDTEQREKTKEALALQHRAGEKEVDYNVEQLLPIPDVGMDMDRLKQEYQRPLPGILSPLTKALKKMNLQVNKPEEEVIEISDDSDYEEKTVDGVYYDHGHLFFNHSKNKTKFRCLKSNTDRKIKGHAQHVLTKSMTKRQALTECKKKLVAEDHAEQEELWETIIELVSFSYLEWEKRCKKSTSAVKVKSTTPETVKGTTPEKVETGATANKFNREFWKLKDYFEQIGKEYLKCKKLVVVIEHPLFAHRLLMVYPVWYKYTKQLVDASVRKYKYSCLNCKDIGNLAKDKIEEHYEFQIAEAMVCTMGTCGNQMSHSSSFSRHFTTTHLKEDRNFDTFKRKVELRVLTMRQLPYDSIQEILDSKILEKDMNRPVEVPYQTPRARRTSTLQLPVKRQLSVGTPNQSLSGGVRSTFATSTVSKPPVTVIEAVVDSDDDDSPVVKKRTRSCNRVISDDEC